MLLRLAVLAFEQEKQPYYIIPPRNKLLTVMGLIFLAQTFLLTVTYNVMAIVTIPLLVYLVYVYSLFARIWCACRYARFYIITVPVISVLLSVTFKYIAYRINLA